VYTPSAVEELRSALEAAKEAAREAEASGAASTAAAQTQTLQVEQLQLELSCVKQQHEVELANMQQTMRQQVGHQMSMVHLPPVAADCQAGMPILQTSDPLGCC
jgi:hypothetical protein